MTATGRAAAVNRLALVLAAATVALGGCTGPASPHPAAPRSPASPASHASPRSLAPPAPVQRLRARASVEPWRLPAPTSRAVAFRYGRGALIVGGLRAGDWSSDEVLRIDVAHGVARPMGALVTPAHDAAGAVLGGRPVLVGGGGATELSEVRTLGPAQRWRLLGHLPTPRSDLAVCGAPRRLAVLGGYDGTRSPTALLTSSDGATFRTIGHLPFGVRYAGVTCTAGGAWVLGGEDGGTQLQEVWWVDLATGKVHREASMPHRLGHETVVAVGHRLLVLGGRTGPNSVTDAMWWFDTDTRSWTRAGRLPYPVADAASLSSGGRVYLLGGETPGFTSRVVVVRLRR